MQKENLEKLEDSKSKVSTKTQWSALILAAGKGTRMKNTLPKVLHPVAGAPMLQYIVNACQSAQASEIRLVVGYGQDLVKNVATSWGVNCFEQKQQLGTAHAVMAAQVDTLEGDVLIVAGDHPLITATDIRDFYATFKKEKMDLCVVTCDLKNPKEFGRIVRQHGEIKAIIEAKDASHEALKIKEVNTSIYFAKAELLDELLPKIQNHNAKKEFYLTEIVSLALENGWKVGTCKANPRVAFGVNTQEELSAATKFIFKLKSKSLLSNGVLLMDIATTYVEPSVEVGPGSLLYPNVTLRGKTKIGSFSVVEPHCMISNSILGNGVQVKAGSYLEDCEVGSQCSVGPYARLRPGTKLSDEVHIGNFVETKKAVIGKRTKAAHLTYLGDCEIGEDTNIGCGTITCNYAVDRKKYKTTIGNRVFVGSDSQFIAPVAVGDDAVIGSGSTITKDVPSKALAVARAKQFVKVNYVKPETESEEKKEVGK